jgi:3'(2'), 5'-bisphosphate nucleotidase
MNSKIFQHPMALCNILRRIAMEAGEITLQYFDDTGYEGEEIKGDGSPVTQADREAEHFIRKALMDLDSTIPVIGEEGVSEGIIPDIRGVDTFWLVDPVDGTKDFISGTGEYSVNIGLIHQNQPVMGVICAPFLDVIYAGFDDYAVRQFAYSQADAKDQDIRVRDMPARGLTIATSRQNQQMNALETEFLNQFKVNKFLRRGSSLKLCEIASGKADLYPRFGQTCEWDMAAGHAILRAAGGFITDQHYVDLTYGKDPEKFLNPHLIAWGFDPDILKE